MNEYCNSVLGGLMVVCNTAHLKFSVPQATLDICLIDVNFSIALVEKLLHQQLKSLFYIHNR